MLGMVLAVAILITVIAVMNGFEKALEEKILALVPHATISGFSQDSNWQSVIPKAKAVTGVKRVEPYSSAAVLLMHKQFLQQSLIFGIDSDFVDSKHPLRQYLSAKVLNNLNTGQNIVLGQGLAKRLQLAVGDNLRVLNVSREQSLPQTALFTVQAILHSGTELDQKMALMSRQQLAQLRSLPQNSISGLSLHVDDLFNARAIAESVSEITPWFMIKDWSQTHGNLYQAIQMSRSMVLLLVFIIIAVAVFNVVSTLVLAVNDKKADIAILQVLGCSRAMIMQVFIAQGAIIGLVGVLVGSVVGIFISANIGDFVTLLEQSFGYQFLQTDIYPVDTLPASWRLQDVLLVAVVAQVLSMLATLLPAAMAMRLQPANVLRHH